MSIFLVDEPATLAFAATCADIFTPSGLVFLEGTLGAGKTTFSRGFIQALGHAGAVKSPTYTLVETYDLSAAKVCHFDLYRLGSSEELEFIGIREYLQDGALCLIEWPDKGQGVLPAPDITLTLADQGGGRKISWQASTAQGERWAEQLNQLAQS